MPQNPMSKKSSSRIQSSQAKTGQNTGKDSFSSRAQSAADKNANAGKDAGGGGGGGQNQTQSKSSGQQQEKKLIEIIHLSY
jgi:hypothetical protein